MERETFESSWKGSDAKICHFGNANICNGCCRLPKGICVDICKELAKFWWGEKEKENKIHWLGWDKLTEVKGKGGLGFRNLMELNTAMLARQL